MGFDCRVYPGIQVVAGGGNVYVGTKSGCLFALDAQSGAVAWKQVLDAPVMGEAGYSAGKVYIGTMGGVVYAADCKTGKQVWCFENPRRYGFSVGVLLAEGRIIIPDRGGMLYAIDQASGKMVWIMCSDPDCGATYQMGMKDYFEYVQQYEGGLTAPPALICEKCGEQSAFRAMECKKCGKIFFMSTVSEDYPDKCPECGYSRIEKARLKLQDRRLKTKD